MKYDELLLDPEAQVPSAPLYSEKFFEKLEMISERCKSSNYVAVCLCTKNLGDIIADFIIHHILIGVSHFFIYDNDSTDETPDILKQFEHHGWVTYTRETGKFVQISTQAKCMSLSADLNYTWAFFLDTDERVLPYEDFCVSKFLDRFIDLDPLMKKALSVRLNWLMEASPRKMFGGLKIDPRYSSLQSYSRFNTVVGNLNNHVKSALYLPRIPYSRPVFPHCIDSINSSYCSYNTELQCESSHFSKKIMVDLAIIGHASSRSVYEAVKKTDRGRPISSVTPRIDRSNLHKAQSIKSIMDRFESIAVDSYDEAIRKNATGLGDPTSNEKLLIYLKELQTMRDTLYQNDFLLGGN